MFKIDEEVYYKGSEEKITPSEGENIIERPFHT